MLGNCCIVKIADDAVPVISLVFHTIVIDDGGIDGEMIIVEWVECYCISRVKSVDPNRHILRKGNGFQLVADGANATAYTHVLDGVQGIADFFSTTGLRPFLDPLDEAMRGQFIDAYRASLAKAYPVILEGKVILRFPRLFIVAQV